MRLCLQHVSIYTKIIIDNTIYNNKHIPKSVNDKKKAHATACTWDYDKRLMKGQVGHQIVMFLIECILHSIINKTDFFI